MGSAKHALRIIKVRRTREVVSNKVYVNWSTPSVHSRHTCAHNSFATGKSTRDNETSSIKL